jgi:hypothetical protein
LTVTDALSSGSRKVTNILLFHPLSLEGVLHRGRPMSKPLDFALPALP